MHEHSHGGSRRPGGWRRRLATVFGVGIIVAGLTPVLTLATVVRAPSAGADTWTWTVDGTCGENYEIPANVTEVTITAVGGAGETGSSGGGTIFHGGGDGGQGATVTATIPVAGVQALYVSDAAGAGGQSTNGPVSSGGLATYASLDTSCGPQQQFPAQPVVVAAGGGGGGVGDDYGPGGTGGSADVGSGGGNGNSGGSNEGHAGGGGYGATSTGGGAGGVAADGGNYTSAGSAGGQFQAGFDGLGGTDDDGNNSGGGGGAGYYGGGGGGGSDGDGGGGGGGGSNYTEPSATNVTEALSSAAPSVSITPVMYSTTTSLVSSESPSPTGQSVTYTATVANATPQGGSVSFSATMGTTTVAMGSATVSSGVATLPYTLAAGNWSVTATYGGDSSDQGSVSSSIAQQVGSAPVVAGSPTSATVTIGTPVTFTASATGDPSPSPQWQVSGDGGTTWTNIVGATSDSLDLVTEEPVGTGEYLGSNGADYQAVFTNPVGSATSGSATLTVQSGPEVTNSPADQQSTVGGSVSFVSTAAANPLPTARWEVSTDSGSTWSDINATSTVPVADGEQVQTTLTIDPLTSAENGNEYRVVYTNSLSSATTTAGTLTVLTSCIVSSPTSTDYSHCHGVDLSGLDLGSVDLSYGDYSDADMAGDTIRVATDANLSGTDLTGAVMQYAELSGANLDTAELNGANLEDATFVSGTAVGTDFTDADLDDASMQGTDFTDAVLTGTTMTGSSLSSAIFTGTVLDPANTTGYTTGTTAVVTWPTPANLPGATFEGCSTSSGSTFPLGDTTVTCYVDDDQAAEQQYPLLDESDAPATETFVVDVIAATLPAVQLQPTSTTVDYSSDGYQANFLSSATGGPDPTVQWEVSTDGGTTFTDIPEAVSSILTLSDPPLGDSGNLYEAVFTNIAGSTTSSPAMLVVDPGIITATVSGSQTYGGQPSFAETDDAPDGVSLTGTLSCAGLADVGPIGPLVDVGSYQLEACGGLSSSDSDYTVQYLEPADDFTVSQASSSLTLTSGQNPSIYGQDVVLSAAVAVAGSPPGAGPVEFFEDDLPDIACLAVPVLDGVATCTVTGLAVTPGAAFSATLAGSTDIAGSSGSLPIDQVVNPAALQITAPSPTKLYGAALPTLTPTYATFVAGDTSASLATRPTCVTTATSSSPVTADGYSVTCSGAADPNYDISYVAGTLTVTPAPLVITAPSPTKLYGAALPTLTPTYATFVASDTSASLATAPTCSTTATSSSPVKAGGYPVTCTGAVDPNYTITYVAGTLTVTPAPLVITAPSPTKLYGAALPTLTPTYATFVASDTSASLATAPTCSTTATSSSPVKAGGYPVTCSGAADPNYDISYVAGTLTITPAALQITAPSPTKLYGAALPTLTPTYATFVAGNSASSLTKAPTCTTTATSSSPVKAGGYPITCSGAADPNYDISYVAGTLTVTAAPLVVTASPATMVYGGKVPTFGVTYATFVAGNSASSLTKAPTCTTTATSASPVKAGGYPVTCSGATDPNYTITYVAGTLTVTPAVLTVTANSVTRLFGAPDPTLGYAIVGFVNGDTAAVVTGAPVLATTAVPTTPVGTMPITITVGTLHAANYTFITANGVLTITKASTTTTLVNDSSLATSVTTVTFKATVAPAAPGTAIPTGTVTFTSGTTVLGTATLSTQGIATLATTALSVVATHPVTATYAGTAQFGSSTSATSTTQPADSYRLFSRTGGVYAFGSAALYGSATATALIVGSATTANGAGYWMVDANGGIYAFGNATNYGSLTASHIATAGIVGMAATPDDKGYWLVSRTGVVNAFGDALAISGTGSVALSSGVVGMAATADGKGYWLVASNGTVSAFGDAPTLAQTGSVTLSSGVVGMAATPDGKGYWLVSSNGTVATYGDATAFGSLPAAGITASTVVAIDPSPDGEGYLLIGSDASVYGFGDQVFTASAPAVHPTPTIVG